MRNEEVVERQIKYEQFVVPRSPIAKDKSIKSGLGSIGSKKKE